MSPPGKKKPPVSRLQRLKARFAGPAGAILFCVVLAGAILAVRYFWQKFKLQHPEAYALSPENLDLSPPPPSWIPPQTDLREEVFRELVRDRRPSRLDDDLRERLATAFQRQPWIAGVQHVQSLASGRVKIEVTYRQPVLMVETAGAPFVDAQGIVLPPVGLTSVEKAKYPRLMGGEIRPPPLAGQLWMDGRVRGGAEIATALLPLWETYHLRQIVPVGERLSASNERAYSPGSSPTPPPDSGEYSFMIFTRGQSGVKRILWGDAPAKPGAPGPRPAQKVEKLRALAAEFGGLDNSNAPEEIDLRKP
jgi:hypothetical protein